MGPRTMHLSAVARALPTLVFALAASACDPRGSADEPDAHVLDARAPQRDRRDGGDAARSRARDDAAKDGDTARRNDAASASARCEGEVRTDTLVVASADLGGAAQVRVANEIPLSGDGLAAALAPQQNVAAGLRFEHDRTLLLTDTGFWDLPGDGAARWYGTSSTLLLAARTFDLDADGDRDLLLVTSDLDAAAVDEASASPLVTKVSAWERTVDGLRERAEVLRIAYGILPVPYDAGDLDGDGDLDIVSYERGVPVGYLHDGAFRFTRAVLGDAAPAYSDKLLASALFTDRNEDGHPDLLVWTGEALELSMFVLLGDGTGRFGAPGPAVTFEAPLVPHGPVGLGIWMADVTGDGLEDLVTQDAEGSAEQPTLNLFVSESATRIAPAIQLDGLGFEFADVDGDGTNDIVTTRDQRLTALLSRGGRFVAQDLGVDMSPPVRDFVVAAGVDGPPTLQLLYDLSTCPACGDACLGRCFGGSCVTCLSDVDCVAGRCLDQACVVSNK